MALLLNQGICLTPTRLQSKNSNKRPVHHYAILRITRDNFVQIYF